MEVPVTPVKLIEQLRSWFFAKDRSIYLAANTLVYLNNGAYLSAAFIAETALSGSAASVTFSSIPQGFRHLLLTVQGRSDSAAEADNLLIRFNGDSGANYDFQQIYGSSATATAGASRGGTSIPGGTIEGNNSRAGLFAASFCFIPGYSRTATEKTTLSLSQTFGDLSADADLFAILRSGHWRNTNVIVSIALIPQAGPNFVSGSRFQLYGIL